MFLIFCALELRAKIEGKEIKQTRNYYLFQRNELKSVRIVFDVRVYNVLCGGIESKDRSQKN